MSLLSVFSTNSRVSLFSQWCRIKGTSFRVIVENEEQVEISFTRMWDPSLEGKLVPLNIDKRFLLKLYIYVLK